MLYKFINILIILLPVCASSFKEDLPNLQSRQDEDQKDPNLQSRPWLDSSLPIPARIAALLPQLSLEEKLWQLQRADNSANQSSLAETGVGLLEFGDFYGGAKKPSDVARARNAFVTLCLSSGPGKRLGLPPAFRTLATHGGEAFGTVFPQGPALGSTFDKDLATLLGEASSVEARALGIDLVTFVINLWADARFGRQEEGLSEDAMLTGALGAALTVGAQGSPNRGPFDYILSPYSPVLMKHVGAYGAAVGGVNGNRADVPEHTVRDVYLKPWRSVARVGSRGVMPSHNTVLNTPAHGSQWLLTDVLRGEFNQTNMLVLSDTGDVAKLSAFRLCSSDPSCAALALSAGVDIEQPPSQLYLTLGDAINSNLTSLAAVDAAVSRVLLHKFSSGIFDAPLVDPSAADTIINSPEHRALARRAATEGSVLLINRNKSLPLAKQLKVGVLGPLGGCDQNGCDAPQAFLGNYNPGPLPLTGVLTIADVLSSSGYATSVEFARGANIGNTDESLIPDALSVAAKSDALLVVLGDSLSSCGESIDRDSLDLPGGQLALLYALASARLSIPIIVILINGRTATFGPGNNVLQNINALLVGFRPGQEGAAAIIDLLYGVTNPSGRLPNHWVSSVGRVGADGPFLSERQAWDGGKGSFGAEHRTYPSYYNSLQTFGPMFHFGEGLSYATYSVFNLSIVSVPGDVISPLHALATVSSEIEGMIGDVVVQVYVQDPIGVIGRIVRPWKRLVAFARIFQVSPGASINIDIPIAADDLAMYRDDMTLAVPAGIYTFSIGLSSISDDGNGQVVQFNVSGL
jgi:beta-glucosidase